MFSFSCEKALLQAAVAVAGHAVAPKSPNPVMEGFLIQADEAVTVTGYNNSTGIRTMIPAMITSPGEIVLNARLFGDIIRRMPDDVIFVTEEENLVVRLTCADADFEISGLPPQDFPDLPQVEADHSLSIRQDVFRDMIDQTSFAVSTSESRPVHTGVLFETEGTELTMAALDGFRLAVRRETILSGAGAEPFIVPGAALDEMKNICAGTEEPVVITPGSRNILFEAGNTELICRRLEGEFLDYRKSIPRENSVSLIVNKREMIESIERVSVVISEKLKAPVRCTFRDNKAFFYVKTGIGEAKDVCQVEGDGGGLEIGFNNRYLSDALRYAPADVVRLEMSRSISPAIIIPKDSEKGENFLYMVLPVRLKAVP